MNSDDRTKVTRVGSTAQRQSELPYEKRVCRVEAHYPHPVMPGEPFLGPSVEEYVDMIDEAGFEVSIVSGEFNRGTPRFHSKMIPPHPNVDNDMLPKFLELAHQKGIIVLSYYPIIFNKPLKAIHPEWLMQFLDNGKPEPENEGWFCYNSPHRDWLPKYLIEFMDNLDIDGFYFDDTNWGTHADRPWVPSCCCKYCADLFLEERGLQIPHKVDFDSIDFKHFVNWRYEKLKESLQHIFHQVKEKYPDAILDLNSYMRPSTDWSDGHPLGSLELEKEDGYFFVETFRTHREPSFTAKILRTTGTPFAIFRNRTQSFTELGSVPYIEPFSPAIFGMSTIANGGVPCGNPFGGPISTTKDTIKWTFNQLKKRRDYIKGDTVKYIALHYSQQNRDFCPSELPKNTGKTSHGSIGQLYAHGAYEILNRSHLLFDFILDEQLNNVKLPQYQVLFLSNSACLSNEQCDTIRNFVSKGGTLIATHKTSTLNALGQQRDNFALADVLGLDYSGTQRDDGTHGVIYVPQDKEMFRELGHIICFEGEESAVSIRTDSEVTVLCTKSSLKADSELANFTIKKDYDSTEPAVTVNHFGKGQAIYIGGDVGTAYMKKPYPPLKRLVSKLLGTVPPPIEFEAPEAIEVTAAHRSPGELMIHLVNNPTPLLPWQIEDYRAYEEEQRTFFYMPEVNPIHAISVLFNDFKVKSAGLPLQDCTLNVTGEPPTIVVPKVELHEVLIVDLE